jgi:beta-1,4-mannosyltransferase
MAEELSKLLLTAVTIGLWLFVSLAALVVWRLRSRPIRPRSATVLVLGDIGRSPRMMYHSESLARNGWDTYFVGYGGEL